MSKSLHCLILYLFLLNACQPEGSGSGHIHGEVSPDSLTFKNTHNISRNGKITNITSFEEVFEKLPLDSFPFPLVSTDLINTLGHNSKLLQLKRRRKIRRIGNLTIEDAQLKQVTKILQARQHTLPTDLHRYLDAYQIWGNDRMGNVKFTGYFTPLIKVNKKSSREYPYPIYDRPRDWTGPLPTRGQIDGEGALDSLDLELAYTNNKTDLYYMHVQGSGYGAYPDGKKVLFAYNDTNRYPYRSIEKYMKEREDIEISNFGIEAIKRFFKDNPDLADTILYQNPSYTFFAPKSHLPSGAGNVPLSQYYSIAVDPNYIPLGSCLLAAVPIYDRTLKKIVRHEYRILVAQDVGGAIKGPGHIDLYMGVGDQAKRAAGRLNHYGRLWLLLPKK